MIKVREDEKAPNYDAMFKVIIVGDTGVGKTCILNRLIKNVFQDNLKATICVEFDRYMIRLNDEHVISLQIWDTAGQEGYRTLTRGFYQGSQAVIMVYDLTNEESYENMKSWREEIENYADEDIMAFMVGNKADLDEEREVDSTSALELSR